MKKRTLLRPNRYSSNIGMFDFDPPELSEVKKRPKLYSFDNGGAYGPKAHGSARLSKHALMRYVRKLKGGT